MTKVQVMSPCPFCGGEADFVGGVSGGGFWCHCTICHAAGPSNHRLDDAVATWNHRYSPPTSTIRARKLEWITDKTAGAPSLSAKSLLGTYHVFRRSGTWKWFCQDSLDCGESATAEEAKAAVTANLEARIAAELELQEASHDPA